MGLFSKIFGTERNKTLGQQLQLLNGAPAVFTKYNGRIYESTQVRACIDAVARNGAKLNPKHIRAKDERYTQVDKEVHRLIAEQPNEIMNAYDFYYKIISELELNNDAFVYISRDETGKVKGLYPLTAGMYTLMEYNGTIYVQFTFLGGKYYTASLKDDVIHLKRHYCTNEITGGSTDPIIKTMSFKHIIQEGVINAIKTTQGIKGYIKTTKAMLKPEDIKKTRDQFVNDFISNSDGAGIGGLDATTDFKEVNINPKTATDEQVNEINNEIMNYYGVNEKIIQSKYSEEEWNAFYESVIEPIAIMLGLEFTNKLFTIGERYRGNKIVFESNRLQYASNETKVNVAKTMQNYMTINEIREIFNLAPIDDGDRILQSLNYVDSTIANEYQVGGKENG